MKLYLDNIRGFNDCYIDIHQVNFLVGENSTGKSTVLSILSLLSDPDFNFSGEFKTDAIDLGPFEEIINKKSDNENTFHIGIIKTSGKPSVNLGLLYDSLFFVFNEKSGFPNVTELFCRANRKILRIQFLKNSVKCSLKKIKGSEKISDQQLFENFKQGIFLDNKEAIFEDSIKVESVTYNWVRFFVADIGSIPFVFATHRDRDEKEFQRIKELFKDFKSRRTYPHSNDNIINRTTWMAPIRSKPERHYTPTDKKYSSEGAHIPTILRDIFEEEDTKASRKIINALSDYGKASGLFDSIGIEKLDKRQVNSPFYLNFSLKGKKLKISNVGYGISQILPLLAEIIRNPRETVFLMQQPEVHLHPRAQAFFGDFLFNQFKQENKIFFIETHSDFIIDRFRSMVRKKNGNDINEKINILFFESGNKGNSVSNIKLDKEGNFTESEALEKYRDFFLKEQLSLLGFDE